MLDGSGNFNDIKPRKNRLLHKRSKRLPFELLPPRKPADQSLVQVIIIKSLLVILAFIAVPLIAFLLSHVNSLVSKEASASLNSLITNIFPFVLFPLLAIGLSAAIFYTLRPFMRFTGKFIQQYRDDQDRRERNWQHYMKKITRVDRRIAAGAEYKIGSDGEIVLVKNADKAESDTSLQINDNAELTHKKDEA
jgi:hypothetical protein